MDDGQNTKHSPICIQCTIMFSCNQAVCLDIIESPKKRCIVPMQQRLFRFQFSFWLEIPFIHSLLWD